MGKYVPASGRKWFAVDTASSSPVIRRNRYGPHVISANVIELNPITSRWRTGANELPRVKNMITASTTTVNAIKAVNSVYKVAETPR